MAKTAGQGSASGKDSTDQLEFAATSARMLPPYGDKHGNGAIEHIPGQRLNPIRYRVRIVAETSRLNCFENGDPYENRTRAYAVRGRRPNR